MASLQKRAIPENPSTARLELEEGFRWRHAGDIGVPTWSTTPHVHEAGDEFNTRVLARLNESERQRTVSPKLRRIWLSHHPVGGRYWRDTSGS